MDTGNPVLTGILYSRISYAREIGVEVDIKTLGNIDSNNLGMNTADLIDVIGILVNNAIEVAYFADIKLVDISVDFRKEYNKITINNFVNIKEGKIMKYGKSHQEGLKIVEKVCSRYKNVKYIAKKSDDFYRVVLIIHK